MHFLGRKVLSFVLSLILVVGTLTVGEVALIASAANYDPIASVNYAKSHNQSDVNKGLGEWKCQNGWQCAEFVSNCLKAGGVNVYYKKVWDLKNALVNGGYGSLNKLKSNGSNQYKFSDNSGLVSKGDPLFFVCTTCGGITSSKAVPHVVLCGDGTGGYITDYAHNARHDGATHKLWQALGHSDHPNSSHHYEVYAFHMKSGSSSNPVLIPPSQVSSISGLKSTYSVGETVSVSWPSASGATSYDVVCLPLNSWGVVSQTTSTSYSKYLSSPGDYFIRVNSVNSAGTTTGSSHYFSVVCTNHVRGSYHHLDTAHPHYKYYTCSVCGAVFKTSETSYVSSCNICNPQYTLQYDANGGSGAPEKYVGNGNITLSATLPTRNGYYFLGWATSSNATTAQYQPGASYYLNGSKTLYAVWDLIDKAGPNIYDIDISYGGFSNKSLNSYTIELKVKDDSKFTINYYSYTLANGSDDAKYADTDGMLQIADGSWLCAAEFDLSSHNYERGNYYLKISAKDEWGNTTVKTMTVYVLLDSQIRIINYDYNKPTGSSGSRRDYEYLSDSKNITLDNGIPVCSDYIFLGWSTNASATNAQYLPGEELRPAGDLYLYGVWIKNENPAKGDVDGDGFVDVYDSSQILRYLDGRVTLSEIQLQRADMNNDGVVDNEDAIAILIELNNDRHTITYYANGGYGTPQAHIGTGNVSISNNIPYRTGYSFVGWATSPVATAAQYQPGDTFSLLDNTLLFAVWEKLYTLQFNTNGGTGAPSNQTGNGYVMISNTVPTRSNYTFLGWASSPSATVAQYIPGDYYSLANNSTLYAVWKTYKCEFCGQLNKTIDEYSEHMYSKHTVRCEYCGLDFAPKEQYEEHLKVCADKPVVNPTASSKINVKTTQTIDYRANVTITATATGVPEGYVLAIYDGSTKLAEGDNTKVSKNVGNMTASKTYTVKVIDASGNVQKDGSGADLSANCEVKVNTGFFAKLVAFFRGIFGVLPNVEIKP